MPQQVIDHLKANPAKNFIDYEDDSFSMTKLSLYSKQFYDGETIVLQLDLNDPKLANFLANSPKSEQLITEENLTKQKV